jgi:RNA polymerase sigma-70 factor, ECF subfamily
VVAIIRRDGGALGKIYARYGDELYGLARRVCGQDLAEDVLQEVFLDLWKTPERFDFTRGPLLAFLKMQVYGRAVDRLRSDGARHARERRVARQPATAGRNVEQEALNRMAGDEVWRRLAGLPDDERDAIALAYLGGHTYRTVATLLGHPEGTIKSRIRSGLSTLRLQLSEPLPDPALA